MTVVVRPAAAGDVEAILASEQAAFADAWSRALVDEGARGLLPTVTYLVAADSERGERLLGHAVLSVVHEDAELQRIAVADDVRRQGVGTLLLDACVATARERGAERVLLEVRADNRGATAFYARAGFTEIARRPRYYRDGTDALVMALAL